MEKHFCENEALILNAIWQIAIFENRANFVIFQLLTTKIYQNPRSYTKISIDSLKNNSQCK